MQHTFRDDRGLAVRFDTPPPITRQITAILAEMNPRFPPLLRLSTYQASTHAGLMPR